METHEAGERGLVFKYELAFSVFLVAAAFLCRDNPGLRYPETLYLFLLLMVQNLAASFSLKRWTSRRGPAAFFALCNCAAITAILAYSGGRQSNLWVLYLLPIFSACLLLEGRQAALITFGSVAFQAAFLLRQSFQFGALEAFELSSKSALLVFCAAIMWRLAERQRRHSARLEAERARIERLCVSLTEQKIELLRQERGGQVGLLSQGLAHDLRNSFTCILGFADLLGGTESLEEAKNDARLIRRSVLLAQELLSGFVQLGREAAPVLRPEDVNAAIESAGPLLEGLLRPARIGLRLHLDHRLPPVLASRSHLHRLLLNLASNSVRAMAGRGTLTIRTSIFSQLGVEQVRIVVEDEGPGIPAAVLARMFKPFTSTHQENGGTGLGLYVCAEIARLHGGRVQAENRAEGGARFKVFLPACFPEPARQRFPHPK